MTDENKPPARGPLKSATGTVLGVPPARPGPIAPPASTETPQPPPDAAADRTLRDRSPFTSANATVKGVGAAAPRVAPPIEPPAVSPSASSSDRGPLSSAADARSDESAWAAQDAPRWRVSDADVAGRLIRSGPSRRTLLIAGGAGLFVVLLIVAIAVASSGGGEPDGSPDGPAPAPSVVAPEATEPTSEEPEEPPLPEARELTLAETRQLTQLRTRARSRFSARRYDDAADLYTQAIAIDPSQAGLYAGLGAARAEAGDVAGAIEAYTMATRIEPENAGFEAALGRVYRAEDNTEAALAHYERAHELDANNAAARRALAELGEH